MALIGIGRMNHQITSRLTIWSSGYRVRSITPLEPEKALTNGGDFVAEAFIFSVSGSVAVWEYNRSKASSNKKEAEAKAKLRAERDSVQKQLTSLNDQLETIKKQQDEQFQLLQKYVQKEEANKTSRSSWFG